MATDSRTEAGGRMTTKSKRNPRRVRCPKCGRLALRKQPYGKDYDMYIHAERNEGGWTVVSEHCLVKS
jgi:hypothetical protein